MKKFVLVLCIASLFCACNEDVDQQNQLQQAALQETAQPQQDEDTSVSEEMAAHVADLFLNGGAEGSALKSSSGVQRSSASVKTVKDSVGTPLMHVLNYPEGGFVIVSATKGYTPVLAYSDENSFELTGNMEDMGPVSVWLEEAEYAIKERAALPDSSKAAIRAMWNDYLPAKKPATKASMLKVANPLEDAMYDRMEQLHRKYGSSYMIIPLADAEYYFQTYSDWVSMCSFATAEGSPPEYTIVVFKTNYVRTTVGPLIGTKWHQGSPFKDLTPNGAPAGCAAIAMSQVMFYHKYPQSFSWNGYPFGWINIDPEPSNANFDNDELVRLVGAFANMHYNSNFSWAFPGDLADGLRNFGYTVYRSSYNASTVRSEIVTYRRPVIMGGGTRNLPNPLNYLGDGHYWVCEGYSNLKTDRYMFLELINTKNYTYHYNQHVYNPTSPMLILTSSATDYYMNWGWGSNPSGTKNGWFYNVSTSNGNYQHGREDFYISKP